MRFHRLRITFRSGLTLSHKDFPSPFYSVSKCISFISFLSVQLRLLVQALGQHLPTVSLCLHPTELHPFRHTEKIKFLKTRRLPKSAPCHLKQSAVNDRWEVSGRCLAGVPRGEDLHWRNTEQRNPIKEGGWYFSSPFSCGHPLLMTPGVEK